MELLVYLLLVLTSTVGLAFIIERGLALRWSKVFPHAIEAAVESCQSSEDVPMLRRVCEQHNSPIGRLLLLAANHLDWPKAETVDAVQTRARHEMVRLERGLVVLEIIVGIAPLLGLNDAAKLAQGISLILRATLFGLMIAIPSLIFWSYYTKKVETIGVEMETICNEFVNRQYREREEVPKA
jgi:biopolymer transport protein ExbB